jgi:hypothetical protein
LHSKDTLGTLWRVVPVPRGQFFERVSLGTIYQNGKHTTNDHKIYQMGITHLVHIPKNYQIYRMEVKYTKIFQRLPTYTKIGFCVFKYTIWQLIDSCFRKSSTGKPGLPDGIFANQKSKFCNIFEGFGIENVGIFFNHLVQ